MADRIRCDDSLTVLSVMPQKFASNAKDHYTLILMLLRSIRIFRADAAIVGDAKDRSEEYSTVSSQPDKSYRMDEIRI